MAIGHRIAGVASAALVIFGAMAGAAKPQISRNVPQWAEEERYVASESGSARAGKWYNDTSPLSIEPGECLSDDYPCEEVTVCAGAQLFKTELGVNWVGQTVTDSPCTFMMIVPSLDELRNFNSTKWEPTVQVTPALSRRISEVVSRSAKNSTTSFKRFRGGYFIITTASSSKGLQGRSIRRMWGDEISEFPIDAGGRGDPIKQARARGDAQEGELKCLWTSTPKELPSCRITQFYEAGDQRRYYAQCPHCKWHQVLLFESMLPPAKAGGRATFQCLHCEQAIDEIHKPFMLGRGRYWIRTYPSQDPANPAPPLCFPPEQLTHWRARPGEGRNPSFHAWQAYSKLKSWTAIWRGYVTAKADVETGRDPEAMKVFTQQVLGEAYDAKTDTPNSQKLFEVRGKYVKRGLIPAWACEVILTADVQGDRVEWDAYAIGPDLSMARFDWGVIEHDPLENEAWAELALVLARRWPGEACIDLGADIVGIDLRGKKGVTEKVYRFVRAKHNVYAIAGAKDHDAVPVTEGKRRRYRLEDGTYISVKPWLIGTWGLKATIYSMLETSREAKESRLPGGLYNPEDATLEDFKQYTGEVFLKPKSMRAGAHGWWERIPGQANERLDLAVYARALAWKRGAFTRTPAEWQALFEKRARIPVSDLPLFAAADMPKPMPVAETPINPGNERKSLYGSRKKL